jgi:hypothetical protein
MVTKFSWRECDRLTGQQYTSHCKWKFVSRRILYNYKICWESSMKPSLAVRMFFSRIIAQARWSGQNPRECSLPADTAPFDMMVAFITVLNLKHVSLFLKTYNARTPNFWCIKWNVFLRIAKEILYKMCYKPKAAGSIPDEVDGFFSWLNPSSLAMALGSTQHLREMSTRNLPEG